MRRQQAYKPYGGEQGFNQCRSRMLTITDRHMERFNDLLLDFYNTGEGGELKRYLYDNAIQGIEL